MVGTSLYAASMRKNEIEIPQGIINFFLKQGKYIQSLKKGNQTIKLSYDGVEGWNARPVPKEYYNDPYLMEVEEYPLINEDMLSEGRAERMSIWALKLLFGGNNQYLNIQRAYMINTSTVPIKINFHENKKKSKKKLFIKRPDTNRIIGKFLYDIISGITPMRYAFNHAIFLEEGIHGSVLSQLNENKFINSKNYKEGIAKAIVHAEVLGLYRDVRNPRNRIIDSNLATILFDFNLIFAPKEKNEGNILIEEYQKIKGFFDNNTIETIYAERKNVASRLEKEQKKVFKFALETDSLIDYSKIGLAQRIKTSYNARNLTEYLEKLIIEYDQ